MKIVNFGSLNIDYVYSVDRFLMPGETKLAKKRSVHAGGKGLNQSIALARAGAEAYHVGILGSDGALLLDTLKASGVDIGYLDRSNEADGHTVIQVDDGGQNTILLYGGTNRLLTREFIDRALSHFQKDDIVLLQNEVNMPDYIIERAHELGMRVAFNAAPADESAAKCPIEKVSWLFVNEIEGEFLSGETEAEAILQKLAELYPKTAIVLTLGADGCMYRLENERLSLKAFEVPSVVDTTAAGDVFIGYFLHSVSIGLPVKNALERASMASALAVQKSGAAESAPFSKEVEAACNGIANAISKRDSASAAKAISWGR